MTRQTLRNRRLHELLDFEHAGIFYTAGIGHFDDGRVAEIFIDCTKHTSTAAALARDTAVILSLALQHGVPIETMRAAVTRLQDGAPAGIVGCLLDLLTGEP